MFSVKFGWSNSPGKRYEFENQNWPVNIIFAAVEVYVTSSSNSVQRLLRRTLQRSVLY